MVGVCCQPTSLMLPATIPLLGKSSSHAYPPPHPPPSRRTHALAHVGAAALEGAQRAALLGAALCQAGPGKVATPAGGGVLAHVAELVGIPRGGDEAGRTQLLGSGRGGGGLLCCRRRRLLLLTVGIQLLGGGGGVQAAAAGSGGAQQGRQQQQSGGGAGTHGAREWAMCGSGEPSNLQADRRGRAEGRVSSERASSAGG